MQPRRFDVEKLNIQEFAQNLEVKIGGRFEPLLSLDEIDTDDIDKVYQKFKTATNEVTKEVVGFKRHKNIDGMTPILIAKCEERRKARLCY